MAELDTDVADGEGGRVASDKVSLAALTALGIGSMIGGGIFGLPQQMADAAAPGPLIIGWLITGAGMLMLAFVYQRLAINLPEIDAGVYSYARAGFGNLVGFSSAWGYWLSAWIGNVGYLVLLMASLGVFLPGIRQRQYRPCHRGRLSRHVDVPRSDPAWHPRGRHHQRHRDCWQGAAAGRLHPHWPVRLQARYLHP